MKAISALVMAALLFSGCAHDHGHVHETDSAVHDQSDHFEPEQKTLFTPELELFVEYGPFNTEHASLFNIHLTELRGGYAPLENARVTISVDIEGKYNESFEAVPVRPGIYQYEFKPPFAGEALVNIDVEAHEFKQGFLLDHVHLFGSTGDIHSHMQDPISGEIPFTKEQAWSTDFNVEPVTLGEFSSVIHASGEIMAMPGEKQNLTARNEGIVVFGNKNLVQGSSVKKGDLVFTISGKGFTDDNIAVEFQNARLQFEASKLQYERHSRLVEDKIVSRRQFVESQNRYRVDSVKYYNLKNTVSDGGVRVFAPLDGYIHELNVSEGQYAATGMVLATVSNNNVLLLRADVPQQYYSQFNQITDATFRPAYSEKVYTIQELDGRLLAKASSVAENNHYMPVYFEVINDGHLLEGAFAEFYLKSSARKDSVVIPVSALIEEQSVFYVYAQLSGERYLKKQVSLGHTDGLHAEVNSGIKPGERIVTRGVALLKAASVSSAPVHSHSH